MSCFVALLNCSLSCLLQLLTRDKPFSRPYFPKMDFHIVVLLLVLICSCILIKIIYMLRENQTTINRLPSLMDKNTDDVGLAISAVCLAVEDIQRSTKILCQTLQIDLEGDEPGPQDLTNTLDELSTTRKRPRP